MPFDVGSVTLRTAFAAMAALMADPPRSNTRAPACDADTWLVATIPYCVATTDRPYERSCAAMGEAIMSSAKEARINLRPFMPAALLKCNQNLENLLK